VLRSFITTVIWYVPREKAGLAEDIKNKQELVQQRRVELEGLQGGVTTATEQREKLENDREEANRLLEQLDTEVREGSAVVMDMSGRMCGLIFMRREGESYLMPL